MGRASVPQFMESSGPIVIVAPLILSVALELGIAPIHLGIIMVGNMEIGMIAPPVRHGEGARRP